MATQDENRENVPNGESDSRPVDKSGESRTSLPLVFLLLCASFIVYWVIPEIFRKDGGSLTGAMSLVGLQAGAALISWRNNLMVYLFAMPFGFVLILLAFLNLVFTYLG